MWTMGNSARAALDAILVERMTRGWTGKSIHLSQWVKFITFKMSFSFSFSSLSPITLSRSSTYSLFFGASSSLVWAGAADVANEPFIGAYVG